MPSSLCIAHANVSSCFAGWKGSSGGTGFDNERPIHVAVAAGNLLPQGQDCCCTPGNHPCFFKAFHDIGRCIGFTTAKIMILQNRLLISESISHQNTAREDVCIVGARQRQISHTYPARALLPCDVQDSVMHSYSGSSE